ncbi:E3 ubiquitin-protein ligase PRT1-like [Olea europaea var. sylvestris]|uniref:E3 ubiquitin-protein ligase PRT1-like n=1 Tax=Olea europaea var. sylvestris TaxID=158386 RepID=UPI000C1CE759|nr:E3 ubiquitin-protein ligase PRT1-like [Olea europaea var. sylvestris]
MAISRSSLYALKGVLLSLVNLKISALSDGFVVIFIALAVVARVFYYLRSFRDEVFVSYSSHLDLLYKPVVLACGHISRFWCVSKSMSGLHQSHCPICRNKYYHFPSICPTLHLFLPKMFPIAYKRRKNQTLGLSFSFLDFVGLVELSDKVCSGSILQLYSDKSNLQTFTEDDRKVSISSMDDKNLNSKYGDGNCEPVSVNDVLCSSCNSVLFQPIVLNCIASSSKQMRHSKCQVCRCPHPGKIPGVCLEFDHFLEEQFPKEYALRRIYKGKKSFYSYFVEKFLIPVVYEPAGCKLAHSTSSLEHPLPWWKPGSNIHFGFGCDSCGMYPIIGDRYRRKECVEEIRYDLCEDCYMTHSKILGRFNQKHTPEARHKGLK